MGGFNDAVRCLHLRRFTVNSKATNAGFDVVCFIGESNTTNGAAVGDITFQDAKTTLGKISRSKKYSIPSLYLVVAFLAIQCILKPCKGD